MSIEDQSDLVIEAIATLLSGAVNATDGLGAASVLGIYQEPMSLDLIPNAKFPALCVYRLSDTSEGASDEIIETVTVQIDYVLPQTSGNNDERRAKRWPALQAAWKVMRKALLAGHHPEVEGDVSLLDAADMTVGHGEFTGRMYGFADSGTGVFPMFRGTFQYTKHIDGRVNPTLTELERVRSIFVMGDEADLPTEAERTAQTNVEFTGPWPTP